MINTLIKLLHKYNITGDVIVQSFDVRALKYVKEIDSTITRSYLIEEKLPNIDILINTLEDKYRKYLQQLLQEIKRKKILYADFLV